MLFKLTAALWGATASLWLAVHLSPTPPADVAPVAREIAQQLHGVLAALLLASLSLAALATLTILGLVVAALVAPLPSPDEGPGAGGSAESTVISFPGDRASRPAREAR